MKRLDWIVARRRELAARYTAALADHPWLRPPYVPEYAETEFSELRRPIDRRRRRSSRDDLMQRLLDQGIATRRGIMLSHPEPAYAGNTLSQPLKHSEQASARSILLPLYPQMTDAEQDRVLAALQGAVS